MMYFFTIHDEAGKRIDDDSDYPMTADQLEYQLEGLGIVTLSDGEEAYDNDGQFLRVVGIED